MEDVMPVGATMLADEFMKENAGVSVMWDSDGVVEW